MDCKFFFLIFFIKKLQVPVSAVVSQGPGLAFIAYPEAVARFPLSPVWSLLFFAMLLTLGLGNEKREIESLKPANRRNPEF